MIKDPCKEPKNEQTFKYQKFKISNPASVRVKNNSLLEEFYPKFQIEQSNFLNGFFLVIAAQNFCSERVAPIFRVSSVTGEGLDNLKTFFNLLQPRVPTGKIDDRAEFTVDDVFSVPGVGTVASGTLISGRVKAGDVLLMGPDSTGKFEPVQIKSIHRKRLPVTEVMAGQEGLENV